MCVHDEQLHAHARDVDDADSGGGGEKTPAPPAEEEESPGSGGRKRKQQLGLFNEALGAWGTAAKPEAQQPQRRRLSRWDSEGSFTAATRAVVDDRCFDGGGIGWGGGGGRGGGVGEFFPTAVDINDSAAADGKPETQTLLASAQAAAAAGSLKRVYVGNLCYRLSERDVRSLFALFGPIAQVAMPVDGKLGRHRGFAFLEFTTAAAAENALQMDGLFVADR